MQRYRVEVSPAAAQQINEAFDYIHLRSPQNAKNWLVKFRQQIQTLKTMPHRCGLIRENAVFKKEVRELLYFSHRILFTVDEDESLVQIHAVRHGAQSELAGDEFS